MAHHPEWVLGFEDETWWSRVAQPDLHAWTEAEQPLRLVEPTVRPDDPDRKALACYGLLVRGLMADAATAEELIGRVYDTFGCAHERPLSIPEKVV